MMKYNIKPIILIMLLLSVVVTSCEDFLNETPPSDITDNVFWKTNADADLALAAAYDGMQNAYKRNFFYWGGARSDNFEAANSGSGSITAMVTNQLSPQFDDLSWKEFYKAISRANNVILNLPNVPEFKRNVLGQAYAMRAFMYFDAYRVWGGVPIFTEPVTSLDASAYRPRATAQEVLDLVMDDIAKATEYIDVPTDQFQFSIASLAVFKAKVHMHLQDYQAAKTDLQVLESLGKFSLVNTRDKWITQFRTTVELAEEGYSGVEGETGSELIFSIRNTLLEDGNNAAQHRAMFNAGVPDIFVSSIVIDKWNAKFPTDQVAWEARYPGIAPPVIIDKTPGAPVGSVLYGDWRYYETVAQKGDVNLNNFIVNKYHAVSGGSKDDDTDIIVYRYADVVLMKALIANNEGLPNDAIEFMNQVRTSRGLPLITDSEFVNKNDKDEMLAYILDERQLELIAEGQRWWDLLITKQAVPVMNKTYAIRNAKALSEGKTQQYTNPLVENLLVWPIYVNHIIDNDKLEQNPAYK